MLLKVKVWRGMTEKEAQALENTHLEPRHRSLFLMADCHVLDENGDTILLFRRKKLSEENYKKGLKAMQNIEFKPAKQSRRTSAKKSGGWMRLMGYMRDGFLKKPYLFSVESRRQYPWYKKLEKVTQELSGLLQKELPEKWEWMSERVPVKPEEEEFMDQDIPPEYLEQIKGQEFWGIDYSIQGTVWTTLQLNRTIPYECHADSNNLKGSLSAITTFGNYVGGELVFPEYGLGVILEPRDVLFMKNELWHGNLKPLQGNRYSLVAFLKPLLK